MLTDAEDASLKGKLLQHKPEDDKKLSKPQLLLRWPMLVLICLLMVGNFYIFDNPTALYTPLWELFSSQGMSHENFQLQYSLFYSAYAFPNMILPFFGGVIVDKIGVRTTLLAFLIIITLAQCLFAFGASIRSMSVMIVARILYGLGGESSTVAQNVILAQWYRGRELTFSFGITLSFCRGGSVLNNALSPWLAQKFGLDFALWFGAILCAVCVACTVILIPLDLRAEAIIKKHNEQFEDESEKALTDVAGAASDDSTDKDDTDKQCCGPKAMASIEETACACRHFNALYWLMILSTLAGYGVVQVFNNTAQDFLLERDYFVDPSALSSCCCWDTPNNTVPNNVNSSSDFVGNCYNSWPVDNKVYYPSHEELVRCRDGCSATSAIDPFAVRATSTPLNLTAEQKAAINCLDNGDGFGGPPYYGLIPNASNGYNEAPFEIQADAPFLKKYCERKAEAITTASFIMSIPYYINIASSPFLGFLIDFIGKSGLLLAITPVLFLVAHVLLGAVTTASAIVPLILQGIAYAFYAAALWAPVAYIVEEKYQGMAYGLMTALLNTGTAVFPMLTAYIYGESQNHYLPNVEYFFVGLSAVALVVGIFINILDACEAKKKNPKAGFLDGELNRSHWNDLNSSAVEQPKERKRTMSR